MAIISFRELADGRKLSERIDGKIVVKTYERKFLVLTDDKTDTPQTVRDYGGAPVYGQLHPDNSLAAMIEPRIVQAFGEDAPKAFHATYIYSTKWPIVEPETDPLAMAPEIDWSTKEIQVPLLRDADTGLMIGNIVGDVPDPPLMTRRGFRVCAIDRKVSGVPSWFLDSTYVTNDAPFTLDGVSIGTKQALLTVVHRGKLDYLNGIAFYPLHVEVEVARGDHILRLLHDGYNEFYGGNPADKRPILFNGEPTQIPVPLATDGSQIDASLLPGAAVFREWNEFPSVSFTPFGLPV